MPNGPRAKHTLEDSGEQALSRAAPSAAGHLTGVRKSGLSERGWGGGRLLCIHHAACSHKWCICRYVSAMGNHVVNPVVTPSAASGTPSGIMAAALVGPDYKYTAVWTPINMQLGGSLRP